MMLGRAWKRTKTDEGMTILEVIAVMVILGILAAIAAPSWLTFANRQRANRATDQVLQAIRSAQADAKRTRRTRAIKFDPATAQITVGVPVYETETAADGSEVRTGNIDDVEGNTSVLLEGDLDPRFIGMSFDGENEAPSFLAFESTGAVAGTDLPTITVTMPKDNGITRCVKVRSLLGSTKIETDPDKCP